MSIIRCDVHGSWDSDFHEDCPRCEQFVREDRYIVLKRSDVAAALSEAEYALLVGCMNKVDRYRAGRGKRLFLCVVVEHDWPEYEPTWKAIESRMNEK